MWIVAVIAGVLTLLTAAASAEAPVSEHSAAPINGKVIFASTIAPGSPPASSAIFFFRLNEKGEFIEPESDAEILIAANNSDTGYEMAELRIDGSPVDYAIQSLPPGRYALNYVRLRELTLFGNAYQAFHQHEPRYAFEIAQGETVVLPILVLYKFKASEREGFKGKGLWSVREGDEVEIPLESFAAAADLDPATLRFASFEAVNVECHEKRIFLRFKRCEGVEQPSASSPAD